MAIAITEQTSVFLYSLFLGVVLGVFYDVFRITRIAFLVPALLVLLEDLLFFLFSSIVLFGFMLERSYGQIRWFILLGVVLGWVLYYFTLGSLVMKGSARIIAVVGRLLAFLWRPFAFLGRKLGETGKIVEKSSQKALQRAKISLKSRAAMLYNKKDHGGPGPSLSRKDGERDEQEGTGESVFH
ncbi:MAG: hypothetical protein HFF11_01395 [Angelakisella sp.]|jgi:spore cortex biosynthesis protein YabQ|nr:hypothetical protein [Angelakisella sp.]